MMNKKGAMNMLLLVAVIMMVVVGGTYVYQTFISTPIKATQATALVQQTALEQGGTLDLVGRAATLTVECRDASADDTQTRRNAPVYIQDPNGVWIATGGTVCSTTAGTDFTSGITVLTPDKSYKVIAFNNSYNSVDGAIDVSMPNTAKVADVKVYRVAQNALEVTLYNSDGDALSRAANILAVGSGETASWSKMRVKNNNTNTGYNFYGFFIDVIDQGSNITSIGVKDKDVSFANAGVSGSMPLSSVTSDDFTFKLTAPRLLYEFDEVETGAITVQSDGDDVATEDGTLNIVDGCYFYSTLGNGVLFGAETDGTSPVTVCSANIAANLTWT